MDKSWTQLEIYTPVSGLVKIVQRGAVGEQFKQSAPWPFNQVIVSCVLYVTVYSFSSYES